MKYFWLAYAVLSLIEGVCELTKGHYGWAVAMLGCTMVGFGEAIKYRKEKR